MAQEEKHVSADCEDNPTQSVPLDVTLIKEVPKVKDGHVDGFERLVLPKGHKDIVRALVKTHARATAGDDDNSDIFIASSSEEDSHASDSGDGAHTKTPVVAPTYSQTDANPLEKATDKADDSKAPAVEPPSKKSANSKAGKPVKKQALRAVMKRSLQFDLVKGKGKGLIILLHGAPGVGKTSTAECVAANAGRALFPITVGDLGGHSAQEVEKNLEKYFDLARKWSCVLLLDEADVFLSSRQKGDITQNSLVSGMRNFFLIFFLLICFILPATGLPLSFCRVFHNSSTSGI